MQPHRRNSMKASTRDKVVGKLREVSGKVQEVVGAVLDDPEMKERGTAENLAGKVQQNAGNIKNLVGK
jgi:CsbD-like.